MKKLISLILVAVMMLSVFSATSLAYDETEIQPYFLELAYLGVGLTIDDAGIASCGAHADTGDMTRRLDLTMKLQRYENGSWVNKKTWTASGTHNVDLNKQYAVVSGYDYRVSITVKVYDTSGNLLETAVKSSSTRSY